MVLYRNGPLTFLFSHKNHFTPKFAHYAIQLIEIDSISKKLQELIIFCTLCDRTETYSHRKKLFSGLVWGEAAHENAHLYSLLHAWQELKLQLSLLQPSIPYLQIWKPYAFGSCTRCVRGLSAVSVKTSHGITQRARFPYAQRSPYLSYLCIVMA